MTIAALSVEHWLSIAIEATAETVTGTLACTSFSITDRNAKMPGHSAGAYLPLLSGRELMNVGLLSSEDGCKALTRAMLMMEPEEGDPSDQDVADAIGEIVNIFAGVIKGKVAGEIPVLELGLPMFLTGKVTPREGDETAVASIQIDDVKADVVILRGTVRPQ